METKMHPFMFDGSIIPRGFHLPQDYIDLLTKENLTEIEPWNFLAHDMGASLYYYGSLLIKYPEQPLLPFAMIHDVTGFYNNGMIVLACFDTTDLSHNPCVRSYDFSKPNLSPWENIFYDDFNDWLKAAKIESHHYKIDKAEANKDL